MDLSLAQAEWEEYVYIKVKKPLACAAEKVLEKSKQFLFLRWCSPWKIKKSDTIKTTIFFGQKSQRVKAFLDF